MPRAHLSSVPWANALVSTTDSLVGCGCGFQSGQGEPVVFRDVAHGSPGRGTAPVAQRIEHLITDQKVGGSNPSGRALLRQTNQAPDQRKRWRGPCSFPLHLGPSGPGFGPLLQGCCRKCFGRCLQRPCDLLCCGPSHGVAHVGVEVGGDRDLAVTQPLGDHLHLHAGLQRQAGIGVPQIVESNCRKT